MRYSRIVGLLTTSLIVLPVAALAQTGVSSAGNGGQAPSPAVNAPPAVIQPGIGADDITQSGVQDIIVTATRRSANLQTVPLSVTAIQGNTLTAQGVKSVADLPRLVPGLSITRGSASTNIYLRGIGTSSSGFNTEAPVATYIDGFYMPNTASTLFSFNNIERVEVLKGPQGTLYGRNATGGLVNVITRDPSQQSRLDASAGYGNYNTLSLNLYSATPLSDTVSVGLAVTHTKQKDGWGVNIVTGNENMKFAETGLQGKILWTPSSATRITFEGMYTHINSDQGLVDAIPPGARGTDGTPYLGQYRDADRRDGSSISTLYLVGMKLEQDLGFANFISMTGYIHSEAVSSPNVTGDPGTLAPGRAATYSVLTGHSATFSQEFQLSSKAAATSPFSWIAGLYYLHDNTLVGNGVTAMCVAGTCVASPVPTLTIGLPKTRSYAGYAEGTYAFAPHTRLTLGLRYTRDEKSLSGSVLPYPGSTVALPASTVLFPGAPYPGNPNGIPTSSVFPKLTYKAVLAQDLGDSIHAYGSYNRGFRSGSYNPTNFSNQPPRPEVLDAFEGGIKSDLFDRLLRVNLAAFHYNYQDIQLRTGAPPAPPGSTITYNAARARVNGVELQANLVPSRSLSISGSASYLDGKYTSFPNATCTTPRVITATVLGGNLSATCDNSGHDPVNTPHWSYNLSAIYTVETGIGAFALAANDAFKSRSFFDPSNRTSQAPYHLVSASLTWTSPDKKFDVQTYVRNLTKSYYFANLTEASTDVYVPGAPRTYGLNVGVHF